MATYSDLNAPQGRTPNVGQILSKVGALSSVALVVVIGVWGYQLVQKDAQGVPVVRATEGPMRIAPADPEGDIAPHKGLSVNAIAGLGGAVAPETSSTLYLAPPTVGLTMDDLRAMPTAEQGEVLAEGVDANSPAPEVREIALPSEDGEVPDDAIAALADALAAGISPLVKIETDTPPVATAVNGVSSEIIADIVPASVPGVRDAPRPIMRPGTLAAAARRPMPAADLPTDANVTTTPIAVGTNLAQLGAFDAPEVAAQEWVTFNQRYPELLAGKERLILRAERAGKTFYRLRAANFTDLSDARRFCAAIQAEGPDCVPVVVR